jgi:hypothetical protein
MSFQVTELSGYTNRVSEMLSVFEDIKKGHCKRPLEKSNSVNELEEHTKIAKAGQVVKLDEMPGGHITDTDGAIMLKDVAIITPCGDVVVSGLTLEVTLLTYILFKVILLIDEFHTICFSCCGNSYSHKCTCSLLAQMDVERVHCSAY